MLADAHRLPEVTSRGAEGNKSENGRRGSRIDFSWTWNEKRKKDRAQLERQRRNLRGLGRSRVWKAEGKRPRRVEARASLSVVS